MMPCARGCCWTPLGCAHGRSCVCHNGETPAGRRSNAATHADPTATKAIGNVMKERRKGP